MSVKVMNYCKRYLNYLNIYYEICMITAKAFYNKKLHLMLITDRHSSCDLDSPAENYNNSIDLTVNCLIGGDEAI